MPSTGASRARQLQYGLAIAGDCDLQLLTHQFRRRPRRRGPPLVHVTRPLANLLLAPLGRDARSLFEQSLVDHYMALDQFFMSEAGAPYCDLRDAARHSGTMGVAIE